VIKEMWFFPYLQIVAINCRETCHKAKSLPQKETRNFSKIYRKPVLIYLDLKKKSR